MRVLVLGAGLIGVSSAWYLRQAGFEVEVLDRQQGAALETSFANGAQISVSHCEPWANPRLAPSLLRQLARSDTPFALALGRATLLNSTFWRWGAAFIRQCQGDRFYANICRLVHLARYSQQQLQALRQRLSIDGPAYQASMRGILHFYTRQRELDAARRSAAWMRSCGLTRRDLDAAACLELEPALAAAQPPIIGGDYTDTDETGNAYVFTQLLAAKAADAGVQFRFNCTVTGVLADHSRVRGVSLDTGKSLYADAIVVALGSYSPLILRPLGIHLPVIPVKGYSATLSLKEPHDAPKVSLIDDEAKVVIARLGDRLRVAGLAEFCGYDTHLQARRGMLLLQRVRQLFPGLRIQGEPAFWCGLRPVTPNHRPLIARVAQRYDNLWVNTGHGTLGWTLACGSGSLLADLMSGKPTAFNI